MFLRKCFCGFLFALLFEVTLLGGDFPDNYSDWKFTGDFIAFHDNAYTVEDAAKLEYTQEFRGKTGKKISSLENSADFNQLFGYSKPSSRRIALVVNEIELDKDGNIQMGVGADWHIAVFIDGKNVFDTFILGGNGTAPAKKNNHIIDVKLTKGRHTVAFWISSGLTTWTVAAGKNQYTKVIYPAPELKYGPCLVNVGAKNCSIVFTTSTPAPAGVRVSPKGSKQFRDFWNAKGFQIETEKEYHRVEILDLEPDSCYQYQLIFLERPDNKLVVHPEKYAFTTLSEKFKPFKMFVTADLQHIEHKQRPILDRYMATSHAASSQFFVSLGDSSNDYHKFADTMFGTSLKAALSSSSHQKKFVIVRGNHEYRGNDTRVFTELFGMNGKTYGLYLCNDVAFLILDCGNGAKKAMNNTRHYSAYDLMDELLKDQRKVISDAVKTKEWKNAKYRVVLAHGAYYGSDGSLQQYTRRIVDGIVDLSDIHLWLAGHIHRYRRTVPGKSGFYGFLPAKVPELPLLDGKYPFTTLTVDGPGGKLWHSSFTVEFTNNAIEVNSFMDDGKVFDSFKIDKNGKVFDSVPGKGLIFFDQKK